MKTVLFISLFFSASEIVRCADILAIIPSPFYSHQATFRPLWRELAKRGHKITLITTDLMESNENITQLDYHGAYDLFEKNKFDDLLKNGYNFFEIIKKFLEMLDSLTTYQFTHPGLVELLRSNRTFDLMLVEFTLPIWPLLSVKFKCPFIGLSTMDANPGVHSIIGNAAHPVLYPYADFGFVGDLTLFQRCITTGFAVLGIIMSKFVFSPIGNKYAKMHLGEGLPDVHAIHTNTSLLFVNANPLFFPPRPVTPITINLGGGLHLTPPKDLPQDLQKYLDDSKQGCIYVSFGTTVNSKYLTKEQKEIIVQVFQEMAPMRILWKFDDINVAKNVENVEVRTWVPQQDILRHPNVKLFITQGGLQSMEEAIDSAVPMLGMPFYGDQFNNVLKMKIKKFGLMLNIKEMDRESFKSALEELLNNPMYKKNIDKFSAISKDQPMRGLEKAVWWTEYVLRHGGTEHLRSPSADIPFYQYYFLDVIGITALLIWLFGSLMKFLYLIIHRWTFKHITYPLLYKPKEKKE